MKCNYCGKELEGSQKKYCSRSHAALVNNKLVPKRLPEGSCKICGAAISSSRTYCKEHWEARNDASPRPVAEASEADKECVICGKNFSTRYLHQKFCSQECRGENSCPTCGKKISAYAQHCLDHYRGVQGQSRVEKWLSGEWRGGTDYGLSETIRNYMLAQADYRCQSQTCAVAGGFCTPHPSDGRSVLEINHKDGNGLNHSPDNLEVICPNCHALTASYRGRNQGNGRPYKYNRVLSKERYALQ